MMLALLIGLAGGLGAGLRYLVDRAATRLLPGRDDAGPRLPWAIGVVNVTGSFAVGVVAAAASGGGIGEHLALVLGVGVCGGYTTFSTTMVDTLRLGLGRRPLWAAANLLGTLVLTVVAAGWGWALGWWWAQ